MRWDGKHVTREPATDKESDAIIGHRLREKGHWHAFITCFVSQRQLQIINIYLLHVIGKLQVVFRSKQKHVFHRICILTAELTTKSHIVYICLVCTSGPVANLMYMAFQVIEWYYKSRCHMDPTNFYCNF